MQIERLKSWNAFLSHKVLSEVKPARQTDMLFRGQSNEIWPLIPSILRAAGPAIISGAERVLELEDAAQEEFESQAHLFLPPSLLAEHRSKVTWWTLMQHYRAPTRLLDWSLTPFVAAYFACSTNENADGAVWFLNMRASDFSMPTIFDSDPAKADTVFRDSDDPTMLLLLHGLRNERMNAQQGVFMFSDQVLAQHDKLLTTMCESSTEKWTFGKLVIPFKDKPEYLKRLNFMNINARTLFPGVDGLGQSVFDTIRLEGLS